MKFKLWWLIVLVAAIVLAITLFVVKNANATGGGTVGYNGECNVHATDDSHICQEGLVCVPKKDDSEGNGKCKYSATATPSSKPTKSPKPTKEPKDTPTASPTASPTDECINGIHTEDGDCEPTPSPTPVVTPAPTEQPSNPINPNAGAPICNDGTILSLPIAFKVVRQGDIATLTWYKTGGDKVNIYYKELGLDHWTHAVGDVPNVDPSNTYVIHDLVPSIGYVFAIEQHQGCGGGELAQSVVVDGASYLPVVFEFSYWQWSK